MKSGVEKQLDSLEATLRRIRAIAETLPEDGPVPVVYLQTGGSLHFHSAHQILPAFVTFGGADWNCEPNGHRLDMHKKLANGVQIVVENAMAGEAVHLTVNV